MERSLNPRNFDDTTLVTSDSQHLSLLNVFCPPENQSHHSTYGSTWMRLSLETASCNLFPKLPWKPPPKITNLKVTPPSAAWPPRGPQLPPRFPPAFRRASGPPGSSSVAWRHHRGRCQDSSQGWLTGSRNCQCSTTCCPTIKLDMGLGTTLMAKLEVNIKHFKGRWWWRQDTWEIRSKRMFDVRGWVFECFRASGCRNTHLIHTHIYTYIYRGPVH